MSQRTYDTLTEIINDQTHNPYVRKILCVIQGAMCEGDIEALAAYVGIYAKLSLNRIENAQNKRT
jgi:hypothetical protein